MKTYTTLVNLATNLANNTSTANQSLLGQLISDEHRYSVQKYFDNERSYTTVTIGSTTNTTLTAVQVSGATSAILSSTWTGISTQQLVTFSNSDQRTVYFTQGSTAVNWTPPLSSATTTAITTIGVQAYPIPPQVSKIKNNTINVGQLVYTPAPVQTIDEWTRLNALPYTSNIPNYYYIYNNQVLFWPIPSSSGMVVTFNYKSRVPDLSFSDYSTGTLSGLSVGSNSITGASTAWNSTGAYPLNTDLTFFNLFLRITPPSGDGIWYKIKRFTSDTALLLESSLQNVYSGTASAYTIGQLPLLNEDFHDMMVFGALKTYFSSIVSDPNKYKQYSDLYNTRLQLLEAYAGTKSVNVDLGPGVIQRNSNLFYFGNGSST